MSITRFNRKKKRKTAEAKFRVQHIKQLNAKPSLKKVTVEEIRATFATQSSAAE